MESHDQQSGVDLVRRALRTPCSTIAKNAGKDPSIVVEKVLSAETQSTGYDALKDEYVDMIQRGESSVGFFFCSLKVSVEKRRRHKYVCSPMQLYEPKLFSFCTFAVTIITY